MGFGCKSYVGTIRFSLCMGPVRSRRFWFIYRDIQKEGFTICKTKWYDATGNSCKLHVAVYTTYKYELEPERYLDVLCIRNYFVAFSRLRCSCDYLRIESGRHNNTELAQRICTLCNFCSIEDEHYFLMSCAAYTDLFNKLIAPHISDYLSSYENFAQTTLHVIYTKHLFSTLRCI